jgi:3' terminal RNA ribose 2'-O-methyltransferase Hen1
VLLTISTTHVPATDLGYLLHKHPGRAHNLSVPFGTATVVYPEARDDLCTAALIVDVDPIALVRDRTGGPRGNASLEQYVNDRPYAASSFLSVAIGKCFGTAMNGRCKERPELAGAAMPLVARLPVVPCRGGETLLRQLFEPLGYEVAARSLPLDGRFPEWGASRYLGVELAATLRLQELLEHLFVLLPVLDDDKHYWVGADEVDKLMRRGGKWLAAHPERELIAQRYLRHDRRLTSEALARLTADEADDVDETMAAHDQEEEAVEAPISLNEQRLAAVVAAVKSSGARSVADLGCGTGKLVGRLLRDTDVDKILAVDVSYRALEGARRYLHIETMAPRQLERVELVQGALTYRDRRLVGFERAVFGYAHPGTVVLTTPNAEYNIRFEHLPTGSLRHRDHRFEWTRAELADWASAVAGRHGYQVTLTGIGPEDEELGQPTQMAVFSR